MHFIKFIYIKRVFIIFCLFLFLFSCADKRDLYIKQNPNLSQQRILAIKNNRIINTMTKEEVKLVLGNPDFIEKPTKKVETERWVYRNIQGISSAEAYPPRSAFPQGIIFVIPLPYKAVEIRIDFKGKKVCKVQKILNF